MQAVYKRELNHSYMCIETEGEQGYSTRMLLDNSIKGLLSCTHRNIDGREFFYYEITSRQSLKSIYDGRKFDYKELRSLFYAIADTLETLEGYLLDGEGLLIHPAFIYQDMVQGDIRFCYCPGREGDFRKEICELAEYILPKIDHQDAEAVVLGYGIYKESVEGIPGPEQIRGILENTGKKEVGKEKKVREYEEETDRDTCEAERKKALDDFFREEEEAEEENPYIGLAGIIFTLAAVSVCIFILIRFQLATALQIGMGILAAAIAGCAGFLFYKLRGRIEEKKEREVSEAWDEEVFPENFGVEIKEEERKNESQECGPTISLTSAHKTYQGAILRIVKDGNVRICPLEKEIMIIGKLASVSDICLEYPGVSRIHGKIRASQEGDYLSDLNSRNGTSLNGEDLKPEQEYMLHSGDIIRIAEIDMEYVV